MGILVAGSGGIVAATGGGSMNLTTPITLCQRADVEAQRGFDGRCGSLLGSLQIALISWQFCEASGSAAVVDSFQLVLLAHL